MAYVEKIKQVPFTGAATALVTPFKDGGVDYDAFEALIQWQLSSGIDALVPLGTTGEPSTLSDREWEEVLTFAIAQVNKRVPVIAGTGGNDTAKVIARSQRAQELGADCLLIVTPYYNKTTQHGLVGHFTAIADAVKLPIILYNVPSRTGLNMKPETLAALADHPNIAGIKEASGDISQVLEMFRLCHDRLAIYSGNDDIVVPLLSLGSEGVITVMGNVCPAEMHEMVAAWRRGDHEIPPKMQCKYNPLYTQLFIETSPVPVKTALSLMGKMNADVRLPLVPMLESNKNNLAQEMRALGLIQ